MIQGKKEEKKFLPCNIFEGMVSIKAILRSYERENSRKIIRVLFDEQKREKRIREYAFLERMGGKYNFPVELSTSRQIEELTIGSAHGGIIAECGEREIPVLDESNIPESGFFMMLDGVEDPYNFGFAIRSIYAAGVDGLILSRRNWMTAAGVVCRSSAGASELIDMYTADETDVVRMMRKHGYLICCAEIKNSVSLYEAELKKPLFLVVGGEKRGVGKELLKNSDLRLRIDYGRPFEESLSTATAASLMAFEVMRKLKNN